MPEASALVRYLNGGCPWCVHFIYDEYYMANLLSVLNSSWENSTRARLTRCRVHGKEMGRVPHDECFRCDSVTGPRSPRNDADLVGETVVFWLLLPLFPCKKAYLVSFCPVGGNHLGLGARSRGGDLCAVPTWLSGRHTLHVCIVIRPLQVSWSSGKQRPPWGGRAAGGHFLGYKNGGIQSQVSTA